ncbi:MAG: lipid A biosynthesis acyltransferase [Hyphomonadaceae bacterium]|nr:lipid A biosynthesis acyltransferase [Hyphomonadaceae bacterium]
MAETAKHWAEESERGQAWGPMLMGFIYRVLGRTICLVVMAPVIFYFYVAGARQRRASLDYLARVWRVQGRPGKPSHWHGLTHFFAFGESLVDKFGAWTGRIDRVDVDAIDGGNFEVMRNDLRGSLIISAHVGATEIVRALASRYQRRRITIVIHSAHARHYNALIERFAPQSQVSLVQAAEFDVAVAMSLSAAIERGEWVVIMGDRMPVRHSERGVVANFLGSPALFPSGPFVLAGALRCPVYTLFCSKQNGRHRVSVSLLSDGVSLGRRNRDAALGALVHDYAAALEALVLSAPYQWFNFYDYWAGGVGMERS